MSRSATLLDAMHALAACPPSLGLSVFEGPSEVQHIPYAKFYTRALVVANELRRRGVEPGDRVAVAVPPSAALLAVLGGIVLAGGVVVCLSPGLLQRHLAAHCELLASIMRGAGARVCVTQEPVFSVLARLGEPPGCILWNLRAEPPGADARVPPVATSPDDLAVIQFTSGTTGRQKGAVITHANVLNNVRNFWQRYDASPRDVMVSWTPLFHDMGLNLFFAALGLPSPFVLIPTQLFIYRPEIWLHAISRFGGAVSAGPNFAYRRCLQLPEHRLHGLRLDSWRLALNGAERVTVEVLEGFTRRFEPYGLRRSALHPVYGLAEATAGATTPEPGTCYRVDRVPPMRTALDPSGGAGCVSSGRPFPDHELVVADAADRPLPERAVGQILLRGPSVCRGYFGDPAASAELLRGGWLHTGDLGYVDGGELFVAGRLGGRIIIRGKNYHAEEIEEVVEALPELREGGTVAFEIGRDATEALVMACEVRHRSVLDDAATVSARVRELLARQFDLDPADVVLLPPNGLGRTSSGKKRRNEFRDQYLAGRVT